MNLPLNERTGESLEMRSMLEKGLQPSQSSFIKLAYLGANHPRLANTTIRAESSSCVPNSNNAGWLISLVEFHVPYGFDVLLFGV